MEQDSYKPLIGVTGDVEPIAGSTTGAYRVRVGAAYLDAVVRAGGVPVVLHADPALAAEYVRRLDGVILTGGHDIDTTAWGVALHAKAVTMDRRRQDFEVALLKAIDQAQALPTLGVCLGMQQMGVHNAGIGALIQHLPDVVATAAQHTAQAGDGLHTVKPTAEWGQSQLAGLSLAGGVASNHHQAIDQRAVAGSSRLRILARSEDGVLEAFDDPKRPFYVGVQWHPERTADAELGQGVITRFVQAARRAATKR